MKIKPGEIWKEKDRILLDVRTPAEYGKGHIPNAINLPLFSDEERIIVGTLYKQENPEAALIKGLEFVGPKMSEFVKEVKRIAPDRKIMIHCWRGGQRSGSMAWLLRMAGNDVLVIEGGYKAYRNFIQNQFVKKKIKLLILGGKTGCGKTNLLKNLAQQGEQVIDLEGIAAHKGSAFGGLGVLEQPSVEQFENNLYEAFRVLNQEAIVWVENENRTIGKIFIPEGFWMQMRNAPLLNLERSLAVRKAIILEQYGHFPIEALKTSFEKIKKRLGGQHLNAALEALDKKDLGKAVEIALFYYDKAYQYYLDKNKAPVIINLATGEDSDRKKDQLVVKHLLEQSKLPSIKAVF